MYKCNRCEHLFKYKSDFTRHKNRKTPCKKIAFRESEFECPKCHKTYATKGNLNRHINKYCTVKNDLIINERTNNAEKRTFIINERTNNAEKRTNIINEKNNTNQDIASENCPYCDRTFTRKDTLTRHLRKYCKIKKDREQEKEQIYQNLIMEMKKEISELKSKMVVNNTTINTTNNTTNNNTMNSNNNINSNNTINIQLVAFGHEDKDALKNSEIFQILKKGFSSVPEFIKLLHFNEERPENHNVYISNMRDNYIMVFDGDKWALRDRSETLENIFDDGRNFLVFRNNDMKDKYTDAHLRMIKKFERFDTTIDHHPNKKKDILNIIKLVLYNGKPVVEKTKRDLALELD